MNDEPSSSASAADRAPQYDIQEREAVPSREQIEQRRKKNRENFNKRRGELLDDLIKNVDLLVYAELSAVYYMDCSFLRFCFRAFLQLVFLTPKSSIFPEPATSHRPYIGAIFGSNLLCAFLHAFMNAPSAGETMRGYLHGGLVMDFIGQKGPTSKITLLLLDIVILGMQVLQLSIYTLRQRLKNDPAASVTITTSSGEQYNARPTSSGQDLDDEERGVRRSAERLHQDDIEMQNLNPSGSAVTEIDPRAEQADRESLLASTSRTDAHIFDAFNSGQIVIADLDLVKTIKDQFWAFQKAPRESPNAAANAEANRIMRERLTRRLLRWSG